MKLQELTSSIIIGNLELSIDLIKKALENGIAPQLLVSDYLIPGMEEIGRRFEKGEAFVPNLLMSARAMKGCLDILKPLMKKESNAFYRKIAIGTVKGDLHDIGKNLVASMFEGCGFEVINLGVDVSSDQFLEAVRKYNIDIICLSALLTTTMDYMQTIIVDLIKNGLRERVKVMVGGAPLNESFARMIGADAYTSNANEAVLVAKQLLGKI